MRILVTNDDGIYSPGLWALAEAASQFGEVFVAAPDTEQAGEEAPRDPDRAQAQSPTPGPGGGDRRALDRRARALRDDDRCRRRAFARLVRHGATLALLYPMRP